MPSENVEMARAGYTAIAHFYETGDSGPVRRHIERFMDPRCGLSAGSPEVFLEGTWDGHDGMFRFMTNQVEAYEKMWIEPQDFIEAGDWLVVPIRFGGRGKHSGIEVVLEPVHAFRMRNGLAIEFVVYRTMKEALAAVGAQPSTER
jgi:hypothetical protein